MKLGTIFCVTLCAFTIILSLTQFWFSLITTALFIRIFLSLISILLITIAVLLVKREITETDELNEKRHIN